jgi:fumarylacetoacetase
MTTNTLNDPRLESWVEVACDSNFPVQNLPYGAFNRGSAETRLGIAIGDRILDLYALAESGLLDETCDRSLMMQSSLNAFLGSGRRVWSAVRERLSSLLRVGGDGALRERNSEAFFVKQSDVTMTVPMVIGDYVDFYSSLEHATNLGKLFRPDGDPLLPNWRWIPIGYHGRSSTVVIDGTPVARPNGQRKAPDAPQPTFGPSVRLDIELEMGFVTGPGNALGTSIPISKAREHIFGLTLVNDWSARDIQAWEYQPLGPFLGKSFATTISPWIVTLEALEPFRVAGPAQDPQPLPYLRTNDSFAYDIALDVELQTAAMRARGERGVIVSRTNYKYMYWNMAQQLAHASVNGTAIRPGDLYASGTISGPTPDGLGSFIELTWNGKRPIEIDGEQRTFLEDGDEVTLRGVCEREGARRIGFGAARGTVVPLRSA